MNFHRESPPHPLHAWPPPKASLPIWEDPVPGRWPQGAVEAHNDLESFCLEAATLTPALVLQLKANLMAEAEAGKGLSHRRECAVLGGKAALLYLISVSL